MADLIKLLLIALKILLLKFIYISWKVISGDFQRDSKGSIQRAEIDTNPNFDIMIQWKYLY